MQGKSQPTGRNYVGVSLGAPDFGRRYVDVSLDVSESSDSPRKYVDVKLDLPTQPVLSEATIDKQPEENVDVVDETHESATAQQLIKDLQSDEHARATLAQVKLKQGVQWSQVAEPTDENQASTKMVPLEPPITPATYKIPGDETELPEPTATHTPITDSEVDKGLHDELVKGVDQLSAEEGDIGVLPELTENQWTPVASYTFKRSNGEIFDISLNDHWKFKTQSGDEIGKESDGYTDFQINEIYRSADGSKLRILFDSQQPAERNIAEWAEIFAAGSPSNQNKTSSERSTEAEVSKYEARKEKSPKLSDVVESYSASPKEVAGVVYDKGKVVPEKSHIPAIPTIEAQDTNVVPVEAAGETEKEKLADQARTQIEEVVVKAVPSAAAEEKVEAEGEDGNLPGEKLPADAQAAYDVLAAGNQDKIDAKVAGQAEEIKFGGGSTEG